METGCGHRTGELASGYRKKLYRHGPSGSAPTFLQRKNRRKDVTVSSRWENTELWKIPLNGMFLSEKTDPASGCNGKQRKRTGIPSEGVPEKLYVKEENLLLLDIDTDNRR